MDNQLEIESWTTWNSINDLFWSESFAPNYHASPRSNRMKRISTRLYQRFQRRQAKLFNYFPDGFAPSPAQPSGVLGQGAFL